ncbi:MAG: VOC family protein [Bacillota bacterium]|nr:VOC family protein [Bacillota bacterium]
MKLGHLTVLTKDMTKSIEFYSLLGGTKISEDVLDLGNGETEHIVHMRFDGDATIELIDPSYKSVEAVATAPLEHFCFEVEDVDAVVADLRMKGIDSFADDEPHNEPLFRPNGIRVMFLTGPSGESIELLQWM